MIDMRSDTVSVPVKGIRRAMYCARVGDDCFGDDPSTRELEDYCADFFGKEAALFTTSGTLSNQVAIKTLTKPGDEIILSTCSHINFFEAAATSTFSGVNFNLIDSEDGTFTVEDISKAYGRKARWSNTYASPRLLVVENTVGSVGGAIFNYNHMASIFTYSRSIGASVYMDGARILHAVAVTGIPPRDYALQVDCLATCFSKSLGAPAGSILAGSKTFISEARKHRKWFGGDMHQSGILAAGALYALRYHASRLPEDHANAQRLLDIITAPNHVTFTYRGTNMIYLDVGELGVPASEFVQMLEQEGLRTLAWTDRLVRLTTHINIGRADVDRAGIIISRCLKACERPRLRKAS